MKISRIESLIVAVPIRHTSYLGIGSLEQVENVLVSIETDNGLRGIGEASPWPCFAENAWSVQAAIDHYLAPGLVGEDPFDIEMLLGKLDGILHGYSFAKAAVEMALLDIVGKALDRPIYKFIGGKCRESITLSYSIANQDIEKDVEEVKWLLDQGFRVFKIKAGVLDLKDEMPRIEQIRKALPDHCDMRIDFNQGLKRELSLPTCRALEAYGPTFFEQPVPGWDLEMMARITEAIDTPIMADESVFSIQNALEVVARKAADIASIKLMKPGGITRSRKAAAIFEAAGVPCYAGAMWESGIGIAASLHFMAATPNVRYGSDFYIPNFLLVDDLVSEPLRIADGLMFVPEAPGLGIEPDWKAIEKYRVS